MGIGQSPLIPLYRLQPDPEARLQRFGVQDAQLFGKPLVNLNPIHKAPLKAQAKTNPEPHRRMESQPDLPPSYGPDYTRTGGTGPHQQAVNPMGTHLDLMA